MVKTKAKLDKSSLIDLYYTQEKTMQDIGDDHGITKERVRQLMERYDLPRLKRPHRHPNPANKYKTLDEYFANCRNRRGDCTNTLLRLLDYVNCAECQGNKFLVAHHLRYPATSIDDIQILCKSCHKIKHIHGMTYEKQLLLFQSYKEGVYYKELATQYGISTPLVYKIINKIRKGYRTLRE